MDKRISIVKFLDVAVCAALAVATICMSAFSDVPLAGEWHVVGDGFSGEAKLPGTLAAAHLGKRWTERDFQTTMGLPLSFLWTGRRCAGRRGCGIIRAVTKVRWMSA